MTDMRTSNESIEKIEFATGHNLSIASSISGHFLSSLSNKLSHMPSVGVRKSLSDFPIKYFPSLDTCKIQIPRTAILDISDDSVMKTWREVDKSGNFQCSQKVKKDLLPFGVSEVIIYENSATITFSSKILKERAFELITINTIGSAMEALNEIQGITFDYHSILNDSVLLWADFTKDIYVREYYPDYIEAIKIAAKSPNYTLDSRYNSSVAYRKLVKTKSLQRRITFYSKYEEVKEKRNDGFREYIKGHGIASIIRVELNLRTPGAIRKMFNLLGNNFMAILGSSVNPLSQIIDELFPSMHPISIGNMGEKMHNILVREGRRAICKLYDLEEQRIKEFVKQTCRTKFSREWKLWEVEIESVKNKILRNYDLESKIDEIKLAIARKPFNP